MPRIKKTNGITLFCVLTFKNLSLTNSEYMLEEKKCLQEHLSRNVKRQIWENISWSYRPDQYISANIPVLLIYVYMYIINIY